MGVQNGKTTKPKSLYSQRINEYFEPFGYFNQAIIEGWKIEGV